MPATTESLRHGWLRLVTAQAAGRSDVPPEKRRMWGEQAADVYERAGVLRPGQREEIVEYYLNDTISPVRDDDGELLRTIEKLLGTGEKNCR